MRSIVALDVSAKGAADDIGRSHCFGSDSLISVTIYDAFGDLMTPKSAIFSALVTGSSHSKYA